MGIFGNKSKSENLGSLFEDDELELAAGVDYNSALDWLTGLSDEDYKKICTVAEIYRKAQNDAAVALGIENTPTTFINQPEPVQEDQPVNILDDEDGDISAMLDDPDFIDIQPRDKKPKQIEIDGK